MSSAKSLSMMPRKAVQERDSLVWQATLAAARRVMGYYASKAEVQAWLRVEADSGSVRRAQQSRLAA